MNLSSNLIGCVQRTPRGVATPEQGRRLAFVRPTGPSTAMGTLIGATGDTLYRVGAESLCKLHSA